MQDILPSFFLLFQAREVCIKIIREEEEAGSGGWPQCLSALARGSTEPCAWKELCGLDKPLQKCRALVLPLRCLKALTEEFGGFAGIFCVVAAATVCSTIVGVLPAPDSAGNNLYRGQREGLGVWVFCFKQPPTRAPGGCAQAGRSRLRTRSCLPCVTPRAAPHLRTVTP